MFDAGTEYLPHHVANILLYNCFIVSGKSESLAVTFAEPKTSVEMWAAVASSFSPQGKMYMVYNTIIKSETIILVQGYPPPLNSEASKAFI